MKDFYGLEELNLPQRMTPKECATLLDISEPTIQRIIDSGELEIISGNFILRDTLIDYLTESEYANLPVEEEEMFDENGKRIGRVENENQDEIEIHMDELFSDEDDYDPWPA